MILHESQTMTKMVASMEVHNGGDYQIVYASQLYGTFFTVGAKLKVEGDAITEIHLALNNYKGLYNIGMLAATRNTFFKEGNQALITLYLSADNGKNSDELYRLLEMNLPNPVAISEIDELNFTRELQSFTNPSSPELHLDEGMFDSEFYVRNGKYIAAIQRMDSYLPKPIISPVSKVAQKIDGDHSLEGDPDTNCMNSKVKLIK